MIYPNRSTTLLLHLSLPWAQQPQAETGSCYIDNVRYVNPPTPNAEIFHIAVNNISNQRVATSLTWNVVVAGRLPCGLPRSDQYIQLQTDVETLGWGVQIYTNNTPAGANPEIYGQRPLPARSGQIPPGWLIRQPQTTRLCLWLGACAGTAVTPVAAEPTPAEPNNNGLNGHPTDPNAFQWLYMEDAATPSISANGTSAFFNGDPFITVKNNYGNHYAQGPETNPYVAAQFGAQDSAELHLPWRPISDWPSVSPTKPPRPHFPIPLAGCRPPCGCGGDASPREPGMIQYEAWNIGERVTPYTNSSTTLVGPRSIAGGY